MAGNRQIFEEAMRQGTNYAWDKQWHQAISEYKRAIAEFPSEAPAYTALGQALVYAGRMEEALNVYQRAARLTPENPAAVARVAELQEKSNDNMGAVLTWLHTADIHLRRMEVDEAVQIWQHLVEIAPDTIGARERLAKAYAGMDQTRKAVRQYLHLATIYQRRGESDRAVAACQSALALDARNPDVLTAMEALQQGRSIRDLVEEKPFGSAYSMFDTESDEEDVAASPVERARQRALTDLASALLEDNGIDTFGLNVPLMQAIDYQSRGEAEEAISSYEAALSGGARHVAARFNLGLLYQETLQFDRAIDQFALAVDNPDYSLGAHFALGECLRARGRLDDAVFHFIEVLKQLDLSTVDRENTHELEQAYDALLLRLSTTERGASVATFINSLGDLLSGEHWEDHLFGIRRQLDRLDSGRTISLAEMLAVSDFQQILSSMVKSKEYLERGMLHSASEECLWAIEKAPDYLPLHLHLGQLFMQSNQVGMSISKRLFVADTFAARNEMHQARVLYEQVLRIAPMDLDVRCKLIALLLEHDVPEQALEHQLALADAYYELAQIEASRDQYDQALRLASQLPTSREWTARILHRLGDIDLQRLDWRSAIDVFLQLKSSVPEDVKARRRLVELYLNLERRTDAVTELDELINLCRRQADLPMARKLVEELLESRPEELELHKRAAQLNVETGNKDGAIAHLDAMGELQLQMGYVREAVATIKAIIALGPENIDAYRQLLDQIA